jgi:hypothetical protein
MTKRRMFAPAIAFAALASAHTAQAQQAACVSAADLSDAVVYAMPIAFDATRTACANRLTRDGFIARQGDAYIATFRTGQDKAWPGAFRFLKTYMNQESAASGSNMDMQAMLSAMPEDALRPFVDAFVGQMIADEIKGDSCNKIERGLELMSPLPTENVGGLIAFIIELSDMKNPELCPAPANGKRTGQ